MKKVEDLYPRTIESNRFQVRDNSILQSADVFFFEKSTGLLIKKESTLNFFFTIYLRLKQQY